MIGRNGFVTTEGYDEYSFYQNSWTSYEQTKNLQLNVNNRARLFASAPNAGNLELDISGSYFRNSQLRKKGWYLETEDCEESGNYVPDVEEPYTVVEGRSWSNKGRAWYVETLKILYIYWLRVFGSDFFSCNNHYSDWKEVEFDDTKQILWVQYGRNRIDNNDNESDWDYQWSEFVPIKLEKIKDILARNGNYKRNKSLISFYAVLAK